MGDRVQNIRTALDALQPLRVSELHESEPMYVEDQPPFLNACCLLATCEGPLALLRRLKKLEQSIGRVKRERYGPREIDLDIIAYPKLRFRSPILEIPHPRLAERPFVLIPAAEIAPNFEVPGMGLIKCLATA